MSVRSVIGVCSAIRNRRMITDADGELSGRCFDTEDEEEARRGLEPVDDLSLLREMSFMGT